MHQLLILHRPATGREGDPEDLRQLKAIFSPDKLRKLYGRFRAARRSNPEVDEHYEAVRPNLTHSVAKLNKL
eukprot:7081993-Pyramimonas_sp.AAC.1